MEKVDKILTICALLFTLIWLSFLTWNTTILFNCQNDCEAHKERGLISIVLLLQALGFLAIIRAIITGIIKK